MKRIMIVLALFGLLLTAPAAFGADCEKYWDSKAAEDVYGESWCWLSGNICYQCYDTQTGENCSSDWVECDPYPIFEEQKTAVRLDLKSMTNGTTTSYCRSSVSAADLPSPRELL